MNGLSDEQLKQFEQDGYLVIPQFFTLEEVKEMKQRAQQLLDDFDPRGHPRTKFSTAEDQHTGDDYFLESSDKISYFFEEHSSSSSESGDLPISKQINKIGHYLHELDPVFNRLTLQNPRIRQVIESMGYLAPVILQSMLIFKQPLIGGKVNPHQDNSFLFTRPLSTCGFWFPLEDVTEENGCLWFIPGSHRSYPLTRHFIRTNNTDCEKVKMGFKYSENHQDLPDLSDSTGYRKVCVPAGSAVLIHGNAVHMSKANVSQHSRYTYAFHIVEGTYDYPKENWIQMPHFKRLYDNSKSDAKSKQLPN